MYVLKLSGTAGTLLQFNSTRTRVEFLSRAPLSTLLCKVALFPVGVLGVALMGTACLVLSAEGAVFQMDLKATFLFSGPKLGTLLLALFFPSVSGLVGLTFSHGFVIFEDCNIN